LPPGYFEKLAPSISSSREREGPGLFSSGELKEDPGCRVYAHAGMEDFLKTRYKRHFLAREIVP
jgi:hypothetical protein